MNARERRRVVRLRPRLSQSRPWHRSRPRDNRPANGTYRDGVATSPSLPPAVAKVRFAKFVERALTGAHERGLTDKQIAAVTGVGSSTFHRWRRGEGTELPKLEQVRRFCVGLDLDRHEALRALGVEEGRDNPAPEPVIPPEVRSILRYLARDDVPDQDKEVMRKMLLMLGAEAEAASRRAKKAG